MSMNGMSDGEVRQGYKLRLALQSCLMNLPIKQFNKCVSAEQLKSSSGEAVSKRIYQYESIFNSSSSFRIYDKLFLTIIEFFERLVKTRNPAEINIVTNSWYIDTLKIMELATIYGNKQPQRVKEIAKQMFAMSPKVYTRDFGVFMKSLETYMVSENDSEGFSLLECLSKKVQAVPNKHKHKESNFHNPEKYFGRELLFICSDCLKLFIYITNVFKFFPSKIKLIFMQNTDFLQVLIKISIRVIYNLRVQQNKRWKMSAKVKSVMKDMQFALLQKITQMYKFIFVNTKNALEQQLFDRDEQDGQEERTVEEIKQQRVILRFYKKLIEGTVNRKKDAEKDKNIVSFLQRQYDSDSQQSKQKQTSEKEHQPKQNSATIVNSNQHNNSQTQTLKSVKKSPTLQQASYGRVLLTHLLRKQLKKDSNKYTQSPYFFTKRLYDYFRLKCRSKIGAKSEQYECPSEEKSIEAMQRGFMKYLLVLEEFEGQVRREYLEEVEFNKKYRRLDLMMRQLPTLEEFRVRHQQIQFNQLLKNLHSTPLHCDKQYNDEPTQQQELQIIQWTQRVLNEDDFTRISQGDAIDDGDTIEFNGQRGREKNGDDRRGVSRNGSMMMEEWTVVGRVCGERGRDGRRRCFEGEEEEELSPEEITEEQLARQQHTLLSPSIPSMALPKIPNLNTTSQIIDSNTSKLLTSSSHTIFKPHQSLKKLSHSMIKQQLEYFNKIKGLNWHQISRISVKNRKKDKNNSNNSYDEVVERFDKMIKVEDIGLSFDMVLGDSDYDDDGEEQCPGGQTGSSNFSYFYYNQWKHESTRHKKKSFMQDYEWSQSQLTNNNQTIHKTNPLVMKTNGHIINDNEKLLEGKSMMFKKKAKQQEMQSTSKINNSSQQSSYQYRGIGNSMTNRQSLSNENSNLNKQCYVRRDYANYISSNNNCDYYYNNGTNNHYYPYANDRS